MIDQIIDQIAEKKWAIMPDFLDKNLVKEIFKELNSLYEKGDFRRAGIGKGTDWQLQGEIRGDEVLWFDNANLTVLQKTYFDKINDLKNALNRELYLGFQELETAFECHFAVYQPDKFYKKHLDQFKKNNTQNTFQNLSRVISCVFYLNENWIQEDGGQLRIYHLENQSENQSENEVNNQLFTDVIPCAGTLVCLYSEEIWHEVLPTKRSRASITGWLKK